MGEVEIMKENHLINVFIVKNIYGSWALQLSDAHGPELLL